LDFGRIHTTGVYERFLDAIKSHQIPYFEAAQNDTITVGRLSFDVVYGQESSSNMNNTSLVLHLRYGQVSFLFTADTETSAESDMLDTVEPIRLNSTVPKVGHHGSSTSSSPEFLNVVRPQIAIYLAGSGNAYGHPHSETIDKLLAVGALVYGTDDAGTVIVETDGESLQVHTTSPATLEIATVQTSAALRYDPFGPDRDCGDFDTHGEAQAFFIATGGPERDPHRLDTDSNGVACQSLPLRRYTLMQSVVIDRFEGDYAILFIAGSDESLSVLRDELPAGANAGDYLKIELEDGVAIQVECDEEATDEARRRIQAKLDRLRRGEHLSNHDPE
jgi:hypothetical protein